LLFGSPSTLRHQRQVDEQHVLLAQVVDELPRRLEERDDSMSPTVPPTSTSVTSTPGCSPTRMMRALISSVICGMTWTVLPGTALPLLGDDRLVDLSRCD